MIAGKKKLNLRVSLQSNVVHMTASYSNYSHKYSDYLYFVIVRD